MSELTLRFSIIFVLILSVLSLTWTSWHIWRGRKQCEQRSASDGSVVLRERSEEEESPATRVHILAFASEDCRQCHLLQAPVLRRVKEAHGDLVTITEIDASNAPELTDRYHVVTVPTTVLLDEKGKAYAVNYGFTNAQSLLKQVDHILVLGDGY